jgi:hypothetical protein
MNPQSTPPEATDEAWEKKVQEIAGRVKFPPTPDIAGAVRDRITPNFRRARMTRLAQPVTILLLVIVIVMLLVPDLRARAFDWLHVGAVRFVNEAPPTGPTPTWTLYDDDFAVTLAEAQERVAFPIPTVPDLGTPDAVFFYQLDVPMVILVWEQPDQLPISLHLIGSANRVTKYETEVIPVDFNGRRALWLPSPHLYEYMPQAHDVVLRVVYGNVLIWEANDVTYRLEGDLTLDEARDLAASLE